MDAKLLRGCPLFESLRPDQLAKIASLASARDAPAGGFLFREGDPGDAMYVLLEGKVRISKMVEGIGEEALAILEPGAFFGEMALIDDSPRSADALAHESCRLFVVQKTDMEDLLFVDRDLAHDVLWKLVRILSGRLRETTDKMIFLSFAGKFE